MTDNTPSFLYPLDIEHYKATLLRHEGGSMRKQANSERMYKHLGDQLLQAVGDKRQADIARELYASQPAVCNWLNGKSRPEPWRLGHLAALLNLPPDNLASLAEYDTDPDSLEKVLNAYRDKCAASHHTT